MLEKPDIPDERLSAVLQDEYGLHADHIVFLPLGADRNSAVYRAVTAVGTAYFVRLRSGPFDEMGVALPHFLAAQGFPHIIAPLLTHSQQLWANLQPYRLTLYPFVAGNNGFALPLSEQHWRELGSALKQLHTLHLPPALASRIRRETYSAQWRESVREVLARADEGAPADPLGAELASVLRLRRDEILHLVERAASLALDLQQRPRPFVLCHADFHAANILIDLAGTLHIVDWDEVIFAPKERDLMFIGGALFGGTRPAEEEEALFYGGYGNAAVDPLAIAYYRYERIVQDVAVECDIIFQQRESRADRERELRFLASNFESGGTIAMARRAETR